MTAHLTTTAKTLQHLFDRATKGLPADVAEPEGPFFDEQEQEWYDLLCTARSINHVPPIVSENVATAEFFKRARGKAYFTLSSNTIAKQVAGLLRRRPITERVNIIADLVAPLPALSTEYNVGLTPGSAFAINAAGTAAVGTPQVAEYDHSARAGSVVNLTGENFSDLSAVIFAGGKLYPCQVRNGGKRRAQVQLPTTIGSFDLFVLWLKNSAGYGSPVVLNRARLEWAEEKVCAGELAYAYGENLAHGNVAGVSNSYVYLKHVASGVITPAEVTEVYLGRVQYRVPAGMEQGNLLLHVHNGHGQGYGSAEPLPIACVGRQQHILYREFSEVRNVALETGTGTETNGNKIQSLANTSYYNGQNYSLRLPAGTWPLRDAAYLGYGGCELLGAVNSDGTPATRLRIMPGFALNFGALGSTQSVSWLRIKNIAIENPDGVQLTEQQLQILFNFKHIDNFALINCEGFTPHGVPLSFEGNSEDVYVRKNKFTGHGSFTGIGQKVFLNDNTYYGTENADSLFNTSGLRKSDCSGTRFGDSVRNSLLLKDVMVGRFWKAGLNYGSMRHLYISHNTGEDFGPLPDAPDQNQGEIVLIEGAWQTVQAYAVSATANTVTFANAMTNNWDGQTISQLKLDGNVVPGKHMLRILSGPGVGGCWDITANDGKTLTIDARFTVRPTAESLISIGLFHHEVFVEGNYFSGRDGVATRAQYNTQAGANVYGGGSRWRIKGNTYKKLRIGTRIDATYEANNQVLAVHFITVDDNVYDRNRVDVRLISPPDGHHDPVYRFPAVGILNVRLDNNQFSGAVLAECAVEVPLTAEDLAANAEPTIGNVSFTGAKGVPTRPILNYYRADEYDSNGVDLRGPRPVVDGALENVLLGPEAGSDAGAAQLTETLIEIGDPERLPTGAALSGNVLAYPELANSILGYLDMSSLFVPMARTLPVVVAGEGQTTPAPSIDAYTKLESDALFGGLATQLQHGLDIAQHGLAIGTLGQLTTADKTSLVVAVNELVARKVNSIMVVPLTGPPITHTSAQVAANTAPVGSTLLLRGYQQALDVNQSLDLNLEGAYFGRNQLGLLLYRPTGVQELAIQTQGGSSNWRVGVLRQNSTSSVVMEDYTFGPAAWAELFGLFTDSPHVTSLTLRKCRGTRRIGITNPVQNGNIAFQCRPEGRQLMNLYLEDCAFVSTIGSVFTGFLNNNCRIVLRGNTKLTPAAGNPLSALTTLDGGGAVIPADMSVILVDER